MWQIFVWGHWFKRRGEIRGTVTQWAALPTICVSVVILFRNTRLCAPSFLGAKMAPVGSEYCVDGSSGEWKQCMWSYIVQILRYNVMCCVISEQRTSVSICQCSVTPTKMEGTGNFPSVGGTSTPQEGILMPFACQGWNLTLYYQFKSQVSVEQ